MLIVAGFYLPWRVMTDAFERMDQVASEVEQIKVDTHYLEAEVKTPIESDTIRRRAEVRAKSQELRRRLAVQEVKMDTLKRLRIQSWIVSAASIILVAVGGTMAERGFKLWYERVQEPLDLALLGGRERTVIPQDSQHEAQAGPKAEPKIGDKSPPPA